MPNFVIEHSHSVSSQISSNELMDKVFEGAKESGHFPPEAIKIRCEERSHFRLHGEQKDFIHVSAHILSGRTDEQKLEISSSVLKKLQNLSVKSVFVSVEIVDIHRASFVDHSY